MDETQINLSRFIDSGSFCRSFFNRFCGRAENVLPDFDLEKDYSSVSENIYLL
jgi:hypothetical protein